MTINKNIFYGMLAVMLLSLLANYFFYSKANDAALEIEQSKGRVEILAEMIVAQDSIINNQTDTISKKQNAINRKDSSLKLMPKYYAIEKNNVRALPADGKIKFLSNRVSKKVNN